MGVPWWYPLAAVGTKTKIGSMRVRCGSAHPVCALSAHSCRIWVSKLCPGCRHRAIRAMSVHKPSPSPGYAQRHRARELWDPDTQESEQHALPLTSSISLLQALSPAPSQPAVPRLNLLHLKDNSQHTAVAGGASSQRTAQFQAPQSSRVHGQYSSRSQARGLAANGGASWGHGGQGGIRVGKQECMCMALTVHCSCCRITVM